MTVRTSWLGRSTAPAALTLAAVVAAALSAVGLTTPARAAAPVTVGVGGAAPATATWQGSTLAGNPDPVGPPSPVCTVALGCEQEAVTLVAPAGFTGANVISLTATATWSDPNSTFDIAILDSTGALLGSTIGASSPATVTVKDVQPGQYSVEVDGDIALGTAYAGTATASSVPRAVQGSLPTSGISASRETIADPFRLGTEPNIAVSPDGTVYESPIFGFSTTQSFLERSTDGGQTFDTLGAPGVGKLYGTPDLAGCPGGGDTDVATDPVNDIYLIDLGGAPVVPAYVSADHGLSFADSCAANNSNGINVFPDRQWLSTDTVHGVEWYIYRDGLISATTPVDDFNGHVYGEYIKSAPLATTAGSAGAAQLSFTSLCKDALGFDRACFSDIQIAGNAVTDNSGRFTGKRAGNTYLAMTSAAGIGVAVINPGASPTVVEKVAVKKGGAVLFPTVAVDRAGNLYEVYVDSTTYQVMYTVSTDQGTTWTAPAAVNGAPAAVTVMPWVVAGDAGRVDIVFYGSPRTAAPTTNSGPWNVYMLQSLNGLDAAPAWSQAQMTDRPNHVDPVCLSGLGCTTNLGPAGDRELGDFFRVTLDAAGRAMVSFADGNNLLGSEVPNGPLASPSFAHFLRQATGPSLLASVGTVPGVPVPTNTVTVGAHHNPVPFVLPTGIQGADVDALNLLTSTTSYRDASTIHVHVVVKNLDATAAVTPPALPNAVYLTRWNYGGQVYYAAAEDNAGQWRYFSGQAAPVTDGLAIKYAAYPATGPATGTVTPGPNGTIELDVPTSAVGSPPGGAQLFSVTSYALTQAAPSPPTPPTLSNVPLFPQVADVLPAYNVLAAAAPGPTPTPSPGGGGSPAPGPGATPPPSGGIPIPSLPNTGRPGPVGGGFLALAGLGGAALAATARRRRRSG